MSEATSNEILKVTATALAVYAVNLHKRAIAAEEELKAIEKLVEEAEKKMDSSDD